MQRDVEAYLDGELAGSGRVADIEAHLDECADCRHELDVLDRVKCSLRRLAASRTVVDHTSTPLVLAGAVNEGAEHPSQRIVLVRHAETEWSLSGQHTGTTDLGLTDRGLVLTEHLRRRLDGTRFDHVLTSPLRRARETCRIAGFAEQAEVSDDLVEWDYGDYEGRTTADIRSEDPDWELWRDGAPGGETPGDVSDRIDRVVSALLANCAHGDDVLVFGHGHSLKALTIRWLGLDIIHGRHLDLGTGSVSVLGWKRELRVLDSWNDRSHFPELLDR